MSIGYSDQEIRSIPDTVLMGLGCGNPIALADLKEGEIVLDIGSGGGLDVFLAAQKVGEKGKVIGVDMTPEMVERAWENAKKWNYKNVEFKIGEIENLPLDSNSVDVVISNCVINLSTDKLATFREAFRVLKSNGRIIISDLIIEGKLPENIRKSYQAWSCCIAGAIEKQKYLYLLKKVGFRDVSVLAEQTFNQPITDDRLIGKIKSIQVKAYK